MAKIVKFGLRKGEDDRRPRRGEGPQPWSDGAPGRPPRRRGFGLTRYGGLLALAALAGFAAWPHVGAAVADIPAPAVQSLLGRADDAAREQPALGGERVSRNFPICGEGRRRTCVVDGDTIWLEGEKIRIADINTPETGRPHCAAEARLGRQATQRLRTLLNEGPFEIRRIARDEDRHGRKLRTLHRDGRSIGERLVAEGLAHRWEGGKKDWCV